MLRGKVLEKEDSKVFRELCFSSGTPAACMENSSRWCSLQAAGLSFLQAK